MVRPDRKVTIGGIVGSIVTIGAWLVHEVGGFYVPPGVEGAFVVLLTFFVSYMVRNDSINENQNSPSGRSTGHIAVGQVDDREVNQ